MAIGFVEHHPTLFGNHNLAARIGPHSNARKSQRIKRFEFAHIHFGGENTRIIVLTFSRHTVAHLEAACVDREPTFELGTTMDEIIDRATNSGMILIGQDDGTIAVHQRILASQCVR